MKLMKYSLFCILSLALSSAVVGQSKAKLLFREDWKEIEAALPVTQEHVSNSELILSLYGPARDAIKKSNHPNIPNDPFYIWSGECKSNWAVTLRHKSLLLNMNGEARIKFRSKQSGFRQLRVILKLNDGTWLISDKFADSTDDWTEQEFPMATVRWRKLNIDTVIEGAWASDADLSRVDEVGFTDLMAGGGTPASSRLDWIEVWGNAVKR